MNSTRATRQLVKWSRHGLDLALAAVCVCFAALTRIRPTTDIA